MTEVCLDPTTIVLVVDDDPLCRTMIRHMLEPDNIMVIETDSIQSTWELLEANSLVDFDVILLDRNLPDGDGMDLLPRLRQSSKLKMVPVIIQSGIRSNDEISNGISISKGAYHYLEKPYRREMLRTLIRIAVRESKERHFLVSKIEKDIDSFAFMTRSEYEIRTLDDARILTPFLAKMFPNPESASSGIIELLINAIEHGNLEIGYQKKGALLEQNMWLHEIERRMVLPKYAQRMVQIKVERKHDRIILEIADQGPGFDWHKFDTISEDCLFKLHGRGIALARNSSFDGMVYSPTGNIVSCWARY